MANIMLTILIIVGLIGPSLLVDATPSCWLGFKMFATKIVPPKGAYHQLDDYLCQVEPSGDLAKNLERAADIGGDECHYDAPFREALGKFVALKEIDDENLCSERSQQILLDIHRSITRPGAAALHHWFESRRRVNKLVQGLMNKHASKCLAVYAAQWNDDAARQQLKSIELNLDKFALRYNLATSTCPHQNHDKPKYAGPNGHLRHFEIVMDRYKREMQIYHTMDDVWAIHGAMTVISAALDGDFDHESQWQMSKETVGQHLDEYLVGPCETLVVGHPEEAGLMARTANALASVELSDAFIESIVKEQQVATKEQIDRLVDWATRYISCKRLLGGDRNEILDALYVWTSRPEDEVGREQKAKFLGKRIQNS